MPVEWDTEGLRARIESASARGLVRAAELVREEAIRLILDTPKTGRTYTRRGVTHQASAPGEPSASDTGTLVSRIDVVYPAPMVAAVNASAEYAPYLEYGTQTMEPRPFLRPALANMADAINQAISDEIDRELQ